MNVKLPKPKRLQPLKNTQAIRFVLLQAEYLTIVNRTKNYDCNNKNRSGTRQPGN